MLFASSLAPSTPRTKSFLAPKTRVGQVILSRDLWQSNSRIDLAKRTNRSCFSTLTAVSYTHLTLPTTSRGQRQMCIRDSNIGDENVLHIESLLSLAISPFSAISIQPSMVSLLIALLRESVRANTRLVTF